MATSEIARAIKGFFDDHSAAGLVLPNGWFGRPYDNLLRLTGCTVSGDTVRVELDGELNLSFTGTGLVATRDREGLTVRGFATLSWDWLSAGSLDEHHEVFSEGEVTFAVLFGWPNTSLKRAF